MDFSNYDPQSELFSIEHKNRLGYVKDETAGKTIVEFIGFRPKLYSYVLEDGTGNYCAKGIAKNCLTHLNFVDVLKWESPHICTFKKIESKEHIVSTSIITKVAISPFDNKRYLLPCKIHTRPFGHYREKEPCEYCH